MKTKKTRKTILPALLSMILFLCIFCCIAFSSSASENANLDALIEAKYTSFSEGAPDANTHPLVAFVKNDNSYSLINTYAKLEDAYNGIATDLGKWNSKNIVIALRANALSTASADVFAGFTGSLKIDLFGNTLTQNGSTYIYKMFRNLASSNNPDIRLAFSIENGSVVAATADSLFALSYGAKCTNDLQVNFEFNDVTFVLKNNSASLFANWENGYASVPESFSFNIYAKFNNCVFNCKDSASSAKMLNLVGNSNYDRNVYDIEINGGSIVADSAFSKAGFITANTNENGRADIVKFGKGTDELYTKLILSAGATTPSTSEVYQNTSGANYTFAKVDETSENVIYRLRPVETLGVHFTPKMSITLDSQLVVNVYIPKENLLKFTFDGIEYQNLENLAKNIVTIDGKQYYRVSLPLPAAEAAKSIKLSATVSIGENTATGTFTFSIPKYAQKILNSSSAHVEKTLIKDVLAYIRSAYIYFDSSDKATVTSAIDSVLGDYNNEFTKVDGETNIGNGLYGVQFIIEENPRIRFYLAAGASSSTYTFKYENTVLEYEAEGTAEFDGITYNYVDISLYAYQLIGDISYTDGINSGSYHINSYYDYVTTDEQYKDNDNLITLVEKLYNYSKSAYDYKDNVTAHKHNYTENIIAPTCEGEGYTIYTCTDCGYSYRGNIVAPHGHLWSDWFVSKNVSKTYNGEMRQNCSNCSNVNTKSIPAVTSGNIGSGSTFADNVIYTIYEDGTLKLTGSGATGDVSWNGAKQPFIDYRESITRIVVEDTITTISRGLFAYLPNLVYVDLSSALTEYPANLFMDSFSTKITSFTIPANINTAKHCLIGQYNQKNALFTDVYIENPDITIVDSANAKGTPFVLVNSYVSTCANLTLYSYGSSNNVKDYADKHGFKYVDLNSYFEGKEGNLSYSYSLGTLTLSPINANTKAILPENAPWLEKIAKTDVTKIVIEQGITNIPREYFKGYTALASVELPNRIEAIGSGAFATESACATPLTLNIGDGLASVSADFLENRTAVTVNGFEGCALDDYSQDGVTVILKKALKILLIGNSLSNDAADVSLGKPSQLYNIIKSMVGDDVYVQIGVLYSGAKTAGWHATVAEANIPCYTFYIINDETNGLWTSNSNYTSKSGLLFDAWDVITLQPYGEEARTGSGSSSDGDANPANTSIPKLEKFYSLSESIPYLLDYVNVHCSNAKIYYYMTWSNSQSAKLNCALSDHVKMVDVLKNASLYVGSESGRGFDGVIPVGTAIQNARSTYLALQHYVTDNENETYYFVYGVQRDNVHLNTTFGRYIAGLSFAEILVPENLRLENYTVPNIKDHNLIGALPHEFTTIAQLSVEKMLDTLYLTGDSQYRYTAIEGYTEEPSAKLAEAVNSLTIDQIAVSNKADLIEFILGKVTPLMTDEAKVNVEIAEDIQFSDAYKDYEAKISITFGFATTVVTKTISARLAAPTAEVVNKNGADATVSYVIDDGNWGTARFAKTMLQTYGNLAFSFAVPAKQFASLNTEDSDGDGIPEYVMVDGKYTYEINQTNVDFWNSILLSERSEIVSHTYTHGFWGTNDDGGTFEYVKNGESVVTLSELFPKGSSTKEIYASKQIIEDLFSAYTYNGNLLSLIDPGIGVKTIDSTISDGRVIPSYKTFFKELWHSAYDKGDLISVRSTFGATYDPNLDISTKVVTPSRYDTYDERMVTPGYMVEYYNSNPNGDGSDDISNWTDYIDSAIDMNGWACFCIHVIAENGTNGNGHYIYESQADKMFAYTNSKNVWVATYTEASMYYSEWSTASVDVEYENGAIGVTLTDEEKDDVYTEELTVKVSVPSEWQSAKCGSDTLEIHKNDDGSAYVYVNIVPDSGTVYITGSSAN